MGNEAGGAGGAGASEGEWEGEEGMLMIMWPGVLEILGVCGVF